MAESQSQRAEGSQTATSESQPQQQSGQTANSQHQPANERQAATTEPGPRRRSVDVSTIGQFVVAVGPGEEVPVPNPYGRMPTRKEIYDALVAAGHQDRADELADKAYRDVTGAD